MRVVDHQLPTSPSVPGALGGCGELGQPVVRGGRDRCCGEDGEPGHAIGCWGEGDVAVLLGPVMPGGDGFRVQLLPQSPGGLLQLRRGVRGREGQDTGFVLGSICRVDVDELVDDHSGVRGGEVPGGECREGGGELLDQDFGFGDAVLDGALRDPGHRGEFQVQGEAGELLCTGGWGAGWGDGQGGDVGEVSGFSEQSSEAGFGCGDAALLRDDLLAEARDASGDVVWSRRNIRTSRIPKTHTLEQGFEGAVEKFCGMGLRTSASSVTGVRGVRQHHGVGALRQAQ